jgi:predicted phage terminase large subunit-like protein
VTATDYDWREHAARHFEPRPRRWATPGALAAALDPKTATSPALEAIDRELVALADHTVDADALAVFMPPQEGKSERCSRRLPEWLLGHDPGLRIADVSYEAEMAVRWGRQIKRDLAHADRRVLDVRIQPDSSAAGRWDTPEGGGVYCVGIGGALTGRPVDVLVIDDPVKDREAAESARLREAAWQWWESVALTRLAPGGIVVLIQTRWHEDDLAGRILARPSPLRWRVLVMPAIAGARDPLGRAPGQEFPSVRRREPGHFARLRAGMSAYVFSGLYQQNPVAVEGNLFRRAAFRYWRALPEIGDPAARLGRMAGAWITLEGRRVDLADPAVWRFATIDVAASERTSADWTVVAVWAIDREGNLILLDRRRARIEMGDHFAMVAPLRARWRFDVCFVERQFYSKTLVADARAAGVPVAEVSADTDKVTRAIPAAGRLHAGKAWFPAETSGCTCGNCGPQGNWLAEWCDELAAFDRGAHDDQVDTFSYAARVAAAHWTPAAPPAGPAGRPEEDQIGTAYAAATGNGHRGETDLLTMPLG